MLPCNGVWSMWRRLVPRCQLSQEKKQRHDGGEWPLSIKSLFQGVRGERGKDERIVKGAKVLQLVSFSFLLAGLHIRQQTRS
jgi:hypothetical protein